MRHIKKKFTFDKRVHPNAKGILENEVFFRKIDLKDSKKPPYKNAKPFLIQEEEDGSTSMIKAFSYNKNGKHYIIPEPDPVLIYFHTAYMNHKLIKDKERELFIKLNQDVVDESVRNEIYAHFSHCTGFVISLFTCIEAFINSLIPEDYIYEIKDKRKTTSHNKQQIERYFSIDKKWTDILTEITGKSFSKNKKLKWQHLLNLKEYRDMIVHPKKELNQTTPYEHIFKKTFKFKYEESLLAVKDFLNFYKPDYLEECDCGKDF